jgi:hypothetical protein
MIKQITTAHSVDEGFVPPVDLYGGRFFKLEAGNVILNRPIRFEITRKLKDVASCGSSSTEEGQV